MRNKLIKIISIMLIISSIFTTYNQIFASASTKIIITNYKDAEINSYTCTNSNITKQMKKALKFCNTKASKKHKLIITVPNGTYQIDSVLTPASNTIIDFSNSTIINKSRDENLIKSPTGFDKYNAILNFTLKNVTFLSNSKNKMSFIRLAHCKNIKLQNITFKNGYCSHFVEIAGCKNVKFNSCVFDTLKDKNNLALQIDVLDEYEHFRDMPTYDGTMNKKIFVLNCVFKNIENGLGTNNMFNNKCQEGIVVENCFFSNIKQTAIVLTGMVNVIIKYNTILTSNNGIYYCLLKKNKEKVCIFDNKKASAVSSGLVIKNNSICSKNCCIELYGTEINNAILNNDYNIYEAKIDGNIIISYKNSLILQNCINTLLRNNNITNFNGQSCIKYNYNCKNISFDESNLLKNYNCNTYYKDLG